MSPIFTITNKMAADLTRIERARGFIEAAALSEEWIAEMGHRALILEAHHTTHIEGTHLTLEQADNLLNGKVVPDADPDDVKEFAELSRRIRFCFRLCRGRRANFRRLDPGNPQTPGQTSAGRQRSTRRIPFGTEL